MAYSSAATDIVAGSGTVPERLRRVPQGSVQPARARSARAGEDRARLARARRPAGQRRLVGPVLRRLRLRPPRVARSPSSRAAWPSSRTRRTSSPETPTRGRRLRQAPRQRQADPHQGPAGPVSEVALDGRCFYVAYISGGTVYTKNIRGHGPRPGQGPARVRRRAARARSSCRPTARSPPTPARQAPSTSTATGTRTRSPVGASPSADEWGRFVAFNRGGELWTANSQGRGPRAAHHDGHPSPRPPARHDRRLPVR